MTKSIAQFTYEREVLDLALASGGADVEFPTHGKAVAFRHRCYQFRKLFRAKHEESIYERLFFPAIPPSSCVVQIRGQAVEGVVKPLGGPSLLPDEAVLTVEDEPKIVETVEIESEEPVLVLEDADPLFMEAKEIKRKLKI